MLGSRSKRSGLFLVVDLNHTIVARMKIREAETLRGFARAFLRIGQLRSASLHSKTSFPSFDENVLLVVALNTACRHWFQSAKLDEFDIDLLIRPVGFAGQQ
jgi:hypothetical protein